MRIQFQMHYIMVIQFNALSVLLLLHINSLLSCHFLFVCRIRDAGRIMIYMYVYVYLIDCLPVKVFIFDYGLRESLITTTICGKYACVKHWVHFSNDKHQILFSMISIRSLMQCYELANSAIGSPLVGAFSNVMHQDYFASDQKY